MVRKVHRRLSNTRWKFFEFYSVELTERDLTKPINVENASCRSGLGITDCQLHLEFEPSEILECDHKEVAATAGRIKELKSGQLGAKLPKPF